MDIMKMTREEFEKLPRKSWDDNNFEKARSIIILPHNHKHDSGFRCMSYVLCDMENQPVCLCGGESDVLWCESEEKQGTPFMSGLFSIDCLPTSGLLRVFSNGKHFSVKSNFSTFWVSLESDEIEEDKGVENV